MTTSLKIQIEAKATRRPNRRVVWLLISFILLTLAFFLGERIWLAKDTTSTIKPAETDYSIHFQITPKSRSIFSQKAGNLPIISGTSWSVSSILDWSGNEISLHFSDSELIAFSTQKPIPDAILSQAEAMHYFKLVDNNGQVRGISKYSNQNIEDYHVKIQKQLILPFISGVLINNTETNGIALHKKYLVLQGNGFTYNKIPEEFGENTTVLAQIHLTKEQIPSNIFVNTLIPGDLLSLQGNDYYITITETDGMTNYTLLIEGIGAQLDDLTKLGKEIMSRNSLSTTAWTIKDEVVVDEIISNPDDLDIQIENNSGISTLIFKNHSGSYLRISKSQETVVITNNEPSLSLNNLASVSSCTNSKQFILPNKLNQSLTRNAGGIKRVSIINAIEEIAIKRNKMYFCWR